MASNATLSASILETEKNCYSQTSWLFFFIIGKIKDAGGSFLVAIRIEVDDLKEGLEIFHNWLTWFLGSIFFALNLTETGKAANYSVMKAMFAIKFVSFLTTFLATLSQMHRRNIAPLLLMLLFESGASLLAVSWISTPALWISLTSWPCTLSCLVIAVILSSKNSFYKSRDGFRITPQKVQSYPMAMVTEGAPRPEL